MSSCFPMSASLLHFFLPPALPPPPPFLPFSSSSSWSSASSSSPCSFLEEGSPRQQEFFSRKMRARRIRRAQPPRAALSEGAAATLTCTSPGADSCPEPRSAGILATSCPLLSRTDLAPRCRQPQESLAGRAERRQLLGCTQLAPADLEL